MPPLLAAAIIVLFIAYLFWVELNDPRAPRISWAPFVWMFLAGSRFASYWIHLGSPRPSQAYAEGSPIDRAVFGLLIFWGVTVLVRRRLNWGQALTRNKWFLLYYLYCLASVFWTDEPYVLGKRWVKDLGNPIMALVLLTERSPYDATGATLRRLSFAMLPLSVLFVKYFPELGRGYTSSGSPMYTGIGNQKNDLGLMCLMAGLYYVWSYLHPRPDWRAPAERQALLALPILGSLAWLLYMSNSQTSLVCLLVATALLVLARLPALAKSPGRMLPVVGGLAVGAAMLQLTLDFKATVLPALGRGEDLTNRTVIWEIVLRHAGSSLVGTGFMSYWTPARTEAVRRELGAPLNQAHNGYLEQYLNLGYIGVTFIALIVVIALVRLQAHLRDDSRPAFLRLVFVSCSVLYNYTEAAFYGINNMWMLFLLATIDPTNIMQSGRRHDARKERRHTRDRNASDSGAGDSLERGFTHKAGVRGVPVKMASAPNVT
jgi:exopolysaccharide production protein ExoQ